MRLNAAGVLSVIGLVGSGLLIVLGAVLPWAQAPFGITKTGVEGDGAITLVLGMVIVALGALLWLRPRSSVWKWLVIIVGGIFGCIVLIVAAVDIADVQHKIADSEYEGLIKVGPGLYLTAVAGGSTIAAALIGAFASSRTGPIAQTGPTSRRRYARIDQARPPDDADEALSQVGTLTADAQRGARPVSSALADDQLRRLARLRDEGLLTAAEFEEKRLRIVEEL